MKNITTSSKNGLSHVSADIDGVPLWFESRDAELLGNSEVYGSALLFISLLNKTPIQLELPVSEKWYNGVSKILPVFNDWWDLPIIKPKVSTGNSVNTSQLPTSTACCFTGGVDSFFTLLSNIKGITHLVFVHGFDICLADEVRMTAFESSMREIANALELKAIIIKTNLREHPSYSAVNWEQSHGSALASIGHLLSNEVSTLIIPPTFTYDDDVPWGSHHLIDSLWSSQKLNIVHGDASFRRIERLKFIAKVPLVQNHLRVCYQTSTPTGNCSGCEKCVRTMIGLSSWTRLETFSVFDHSIPLVKRIDSLQPLSTHLEIVYRDFLSRDISNELKSAIRRLLKRTKRSQNLSKLKRLVLNLFKRRFSAAGTT